MRIRLQISEADANALTDETGEISRSLQWHLDLYEYNTAQFEEVYEQEQEPGLYGELPFVAVFCNLWSVATYLEDLAYGGPAEGGWYYTYGEIQNLPVLYFTTRTEARAAAALLNHWMDESTEWNKGRPSISNTNSEGLFRARYGAGHPKHHYPERKPHYE